MADTPGRKVRRDDSFGYCFLGDVDYKYSRESRTGNSFSELREKVINRASAPPPEAFSAVGGEDPYDVLEHCDEVVLFHSVDGSRHLSPDKVTSLLRTDGSPRAEWLANIGSRDVADNEICGDLTAEVCIIVNGSGCKGRCTASDRESKSLPHSHSYAKVPRCRRHWGTYLTRSGPVNFRVRFPLLSVLSRFSSSSSTLGRKGRERYSGR